MNRIKYQEDEANRIYGRLFEKDGNSEESVSHKYLLADEVGLGKTIVAAMVIAKLAVDRMNKGERKASELHIYAVMGHLQMRISES